VASYCSNLEHLDLSRTLVGPRGVYALEKSFLKDKILNNESFGKSSGSGNIFHSFLKGLYLDYTRAMSDGGIRLAHFLEVAGQDLLDLSIHTCVFSFLF
jgi:hypothetical protein